MFHNWLLIITVVLQAAKYLTNNFKRFEIGGHSLCVADMVSGKIT